MSLQFYFSITEDEKKIFNVKEATLKIAAKDVTSAYSPTSLMGGSTFLDYNIPRNRCAYLYKYAAIHTGLVFKYFTEMLDLTSAKAVLDFKKDIKICCLGGGPGTDIVGICKALAAFPSFYKKVTQVTVLDLCGGWRNSFKHIISRLRHGKVEGVPVSFINSSDFKADLMAVNLLEPLPASIVKVISNADIICMVKFVSAIIGKQESVNALKVIGNHMKLGASVLFIDNVCDRVSGAVKMISEQCGFSNVLGPLHGSYKYANTKTKKDIYGCLPCCKIKVSVIGWMKTASLQIDLSNYRNFVPVNSAGEDEDSWNTESDSDDDVPTNMILKNSKTRNKFLSKTICDKFTQTAESYLNTSKSGIDHNLDESEISDLCSLMESVNNLLVVMENFKTYKSSRKCCSSHSCESHCHV
ncbi:uncharacterized protein LOC129981110 [Argiope bruennichi]|uniref:Uncharacterized protein n=1 Tax=Argiope bruennichi TaxID=94029 RepID=A0A8T0G0N6_ARGBR|nr:uncharacterized protein LOC129981110 [Argiope bruennichi]KAF8796476.1 hypothetical protein HNY73_000846 [Argiope bruennichi]